MSSVTSVVLTMVGDPDSAASLDRVAAAVGARPTATENPSRRAWLGAAAIVVDERSALHCARLGLPRRDGVVLVSPGEPSAAAWAAAVEVGAQHLCALPVQEAELVRLLAEATESVSVTGRFGPVIGVVGGRGGARVARSRRELPNWPRSNATMSPTPQRPQRNGPAFSSPVRWVSASCRPSYAWASRPWSRVWPATCSVRVCYDPMPINREIPTTREEKQCCTE